MFTLLLLLALAAAMTPLHDPLHDQTGKAPVAHKCIHDKVAQVSARAQPRASSQRSFAL
jgi:hypothetical protein